jgi:Domain of unknown function (DUF5666)
MFKRLVSILAMFTVSATLTFAHGDATHLTGTITAIEGDHIQIKDQAGKPVLVMLQKTTKFLKSNKPATKADLKVGTRVLIDAKMDEKMKMYAAEEVSIGITEPAKPAPANTGATKTR